jgi:hypothetical protein
MTAAGLQSLRPGQATTMADRNNGTLAEPVQLSDTACKALFVGGLIVWL